ncbi:MAG: LegC family aminotransferase [Pseudomonadota bacterium]|jgi:aminotransferase in exopolysaccharide biosynthesis|nr:LegC family aminotransferase [Pseudomonadota bacterium]
MFNEIVQFIRKIFDTKGLIPLHEPRFIGNEKKYLNECIDSTYVSYVGAFVERFEDMVEDFTGSRFAVSTANGTLALHLALMTIGVKPGDEVITQALTFVATANAIIHCGAKPVFVDCDRETLGMSHEKLEEFLNENTLLGDDGYCYNKKTGKRIAACVPVHVFGHPVNIKAIKETCKSYGIRVVEDAAESLGSFFENKHTGTFAHIGILSFNGNKIVTTGGGGMVITDDEGLAQRARHIATTAKRIHQWEFIHDEIGYNYRMPNVNAAIGCAQMEKLDFFLENKRELARIYKEFFGNIGIEYFSERKGCCSNYWLNTIIVKDKSQRDAFLDFAHKNGVMSRPAWTLLNKLPMYKDCETTDLEHAQWLEDRIVNLPSSVRI